MYKAGTVSELSAFRDSLSDEVYQEALGIVAMLDDMFGEDRDVDFDDGGFVVIAENQEDLASFTQAYVELESELLEYVELVAASKELYLKAFYLYNEYESGITLFLPLSIAPKKLLKQAGRV